MISDVSIAILAGGQSRRMGTDKSFVTLNGKTMIERVLDQVLALDLPVVIVANQVERYSDFGLPVFPDVIEGKGSLGGLYTALFHSSTTYTVCVACDMPFLSPQLLTYLIQLRHEYDAVVPEVNRRLQPLHAVYNRTCLKPLKTLIERNQLAIYGLYNFINTRVVPQSTLARLATDLRSFDNVNTPDDLALAVQDMETT
ncbi:MAG: molybdenum cofactor guanylyltransferase [Anaerolineae bacterium]|nr:molybdenum cofactor guanylyltransferase [Chloroflexota bacterium]MBP6297894.1 molybdenum cofactor guanylyltransferase [Anaerolineae bacterium]